jgi:hypothetical protein
MTGATHRVSFESDVVGEAPRGRVATCTGAGDPRWTVEQDPTAPSRSNFLR